MWHNISIISDIYTEKMQHTGDTLIFTNCKSVLLTLEQQSFKSHTPSLRTMLSQSLCSSGYRGTATFQQMSVQANLQNMVVQQKITN